MIIDKEKLYERIRNHRFFNLNGEPLEKRVSNLNSAIDNSIYKIGNFILKEQDRIHLAYSGGVDSTIVLTTLINQGFPVTAHTIANKETHPDMIYASEFASELTNSGKNISHKKYLIEESRENRAKANQILKAEFDEEETNKSENDYELLNAIKSETSNLVCCDCIDELLGGYYAHKDPSNLPVYDKTKTLEKNREVALKYFMNGLIPNHLRKLNTFSKHFGINVWLPYGDEKVMRATENFSVNELIDNENRKKPVSAIARIKNIPEAIIYRRKYGLVSALDQERKK